MIRQWAILLIAAPLVAATCAGCGTKGIAADSGKTAPVLAAPTMAAPVAKVIEKPAPAVETSPSPAPAVESAPPPAAATEASNVESPSHEEAPAPRPKPAARLVDKTFDDIKFEMTPEDPFRRELIGEKIESLAGQRIRIRGYILPTSQKRGIKQFVLVRDNQQCCFGPGAALYDCILVEMQSGRTAEFSIRPVAVEGTFNIDVLAGDDGKPLAIYHLVGESVK